ncbi:hypothetical protein S83_019633, partial [Arachis hypogaea]
IKSGHGSGHIEQTKPPKSYFLDWLLCRETIFLLRFIFVMETKLNCCEECASNYEKKSQFLRPGHKKTLPLWLQPHTTETNHQKDELTS